MRLLTIVCGVFLLTGFAKSTDHLAPVENFEVDRYLGQWYEIGRYTMRFERNLEAVTANYTKKDNGSVGVINRGFHILKNKWSEADGKAKFKGDTDQGYLRVSFFGPFYADYKIIALDPDYQWSIVTSGSYKYLWILSRSPLMDEELKNDLINKVKNFGFDPQQIHWVDQSLNITSVEG